MDPEAPRSSYDRITVIVVAFHSDDVVFDLLSRLPEGMPAIIVDNSPDDALGQALRERGSPARYVSRPDNPGYGGAANAGAALAATDFIAIANPDLDLPADLFDECVALFDDDPTLGLAGELRKMRIRKLVLGQYVNGAFLFCRRRDFLKLGGFDEEYFLFWEDIDLTIRFVKAGFKVAKPACIAPHADGNSVRTSFDSNPEREWVIGAAASILISKHRVSLASLFAVKVLFQRWRAARRANVPCEPLRGAMAVWREGFATVRSNLFTTGVRRSLPPVMPGGFEGGAR